MYDTWHSSDDWKIQCFNEIPIFIKDKENCSHGKTSQDRKKGQKYPPCISGAAVRWFVSIQLSQSFLLSGFNYVSGEVIDSREDRHQPDQQHEDSEDSLLIGLGSEVACMCKHSNSGAPVVMICTISIKE